MLNELGRMMIINHDANFAFVHIPKCGGTTVAKQLHHYDQGELSQPGFAEISGLGTVDRMHIPLEVLRQHFPETFRKLRNYRSYALIRHPLKRFQSSVFQYNVMYGDNAVTRTQLELSVNRIIEDLNEFDDGTRSALPHTHIHFQRQADYIYSAGERLITHLYRLDEIDAMLSDATDYLIGAGGTVPDRPNPHAFPTATRVAQHNQSRVYRSKLHALTARIGGRVIRTISGQQLYSEIAKSSRGLFLTTNIDSYAPIFNSDHVRQFVDEYYAEDLKIYERQPS